MSKNDPEPKLFLIANSIFPYRYDAVKILALPSGSIYRARFHTKFVSEQVQKEYGNLNGRLGHYCFRDYETGVIIPLRNIAVSNVFKIGEIFYIEYLLGDFYNFPQSEIVCEEQVQTFNKNLRRGFQFNDDIAGRDMNPLLFTSQVQVSFNDEIDNNMSGYEKQIKCWSYIARYLGNFNYFKFIPFLRVVGIRKLQRGSFIPVTNNMSIKGDTEYELQIIHLLRTDSAEPHNINKSRTDRNAEFIKKASYKFNARALPDHYSFLKESIIMTGSYDVKSIIFKTKNIYQSSIAHINLDYEKPPLSINGIETDLTLSFSITPSMKFPIVRIMLIIAFSSIYLLPNYVPGIFQYIGANPRLLQDLSIIAIALTSFDVLGRLGVMIDRTK
jgi:hypothetical protein